MMISQATTLRIFLLSLAIIVGAAEGRAQMSADVATKYFLEAPLADVDASILPSGARDVIVGRVRILSGPIYLIERDQSGQVPPLPKDLFFTRVEFIEVVKGKSATGEQAELYFGIPEVGRRYKYPHTPNQKTRDYFIASFMAEDNVRRLVGFPITEQEYEEWRKEVSEYEQARGRSGARN